MNVSKVSRDVLDYKGLIITIIKQDYNSICKSIHDMDDAINEGFLIVCKCFDRIKANPTNYPDIDKYICANIRSRLKTYMFIKHAHDKKTVTLRYLPFKPRKEYPPSEKLWLLDEVEKRLNNPKIKLAFQLYRQGYSYEDISKEVGLTPRYIQYNMWTYLRGTAVKIMKERSNGTMDYMSMF